MKSMYKVLAAAMLMVFSFTAMAESTPIQFSFFDFNAPKTKDVSGVRFPAIYGKQGGNVAGVDFQLLAYSEMESLKGVSYPLILVGANRIKGDMTGASFGLMNWHEGTDIGANLGLLNLTQSMKTGANLGGVNIAKGYTMVDISLVNLSAKSNFQLGIFNKTDEIAGVQIGLINCAKDGFLPCFPFVLF